MTHLIVGMALGIGMSSVALLLYIWWVMPSNIDGEGE